jgi:pimeloyl-ACP methyl ester carboxylesterase
MIGIFSAGCAIARENDEAAASSEDGLTLDRDAPRPPFYEPPSVLPAQNGAIIRSEPLTTWLGKTELVVTATRILYRSTSRKGSPIAVSGSVLVPTAAWKGPGERPVIGYAVGTQGIGDSCAPSRQIREGFEYEGMFMAGLLARGYALAVTDYEGLGTPGMHTYMDRVSQGHTVLDAVRAAERLPGTGLSTASPVGIVGYSQGGGAAASAAELAGIYAPELPVKGTAAGAVPADLSVMPSNLDGTVWAEFLWFAIAGTSASYDFDFLPLLNDKGRAFYANASDDCVFDLFNAALKRSSTFTRDGSSLDDIVKTEPFRTMIDDQRIGRIKPSAPVLVTHSRLDDTIPFEVGEQLAADWCSLGATVEFSPNLTPMHVGGMINHVGELYGFFEDRFAGRPAKSTCASN